MKATKLCAFPQAMPKGLRELKHWIPWALAQRTRRDGTTRTDKVPTVPQWDMPSSHRTAEEVMQHIRPEEGLGFVFPTGAVHYEGHRLFALDLDSCRDPQTGTLHTWAKNLVKHCGRTFTEVTVSGTGLRVWVKVRNPPSRWARKKWKPSHSEPPTNGKAVECQVFGAGNACFVTVTGNLVVPTAGIETIEDLSFWPTVFGRPAEVTPGDDDEDTSDTLEALPQGYGPPLTLDELHETLLDQGYEPLIEGDITGVTRAPDEEGLVPETTNSEAYFRLVAATLHAARGQGPLVMAFLLNRTAFARDEHTFNPKYGREDWVEREVRRVAARTGAGLTPFKPILDDEAVLAPALGQLQATPTAKTSAEVRREALARCWHRASLQQWLAKPAATWWLKGYARAGQVGFLVAFPTVGKSTLAASWVMHTAYGAPWNGNKVRKGHVLVLAGENLQGFARTLQAYEQHAQTLLSSTGTGPQERAKVDLVDFRAPLSGKLGQEAIVALMEEATADYEAPPALLVIDTLSAHWAEDEDSAEFGAPAMRAFAQVAARWQAVVLIVHHVTKAKGKAILPELQDVRGSSTFIGNADFILAMAQADTGVLLAGLKSKSDLPAPQISLTRTVVSLGSDSEGDEVTAAVFEAEAVTVTEAVKEQVQETQNEDAINILLEALQRLGRVKAKDEVVTLAIQHGVPQRLGRALFTEAENRGFLTRVGGRSNGVWMLTPVGKSRLSFAENNGETPGIGGGSSTDGV